MPERKVKLIITAEDRSTREVDGARKRLQTLGTSAIKTGFKMTAGLTLPIVAAGTAIAKIAGDFEAQTNIMAIAARSSGTSLEDLEAAAIATGADIELVGIDAVQAADAMTEFYKAGLSTSDIFGGADGLNQYLETGSDLAGAFRASVDLAAASDLDLAQSAETVTIAMATFGIGAADPTGSDIFMVKGKDMLLLKGITDKGEKFLGSIDFIEGASAKDKEYFEERLAGASLLETRTLATEGTAEKLEAVFENPYWVGRRPCLNCGCVPLYAHLSLL